MAGTRVRSIATRLAPALVAPLAFVIGAARLRSHWSRTGQYRLSGDEPKYLVAARSLWVYHTANLKRAATDAFRKHRFVYWGAHPFSTPTRTGIRHTAHGFFSSHGLGVPLVVGPAVLFGGSAGARAVMLVIAMAVPVVVYFVLRCEGCSAARSAYLAIALAVSAPLLAHSTQIYPDMPGGVIAAAVILLLLIRANSGALEHPVVRYLTLAVVALMPWLHVRFLLPAAILTGAIIFVRRRWSWRSALLEVSPAFLSAAALAGYNLYAWGHLSGTDRSGGQELAPGWQAFLRFLALNVDRFQGMFVQQPLLILAIPGVVLLFRRTRDIALVTVGLYLAFLAPNALHPNWFGGASFTGRFGLSAAIVLVVPAAVALAALARRFAVLISVLAGIAIWLNLWLYSRIWNGALPLIGQPPGEPRSAYPSWLPPLGRSLPALNRVRWGASFGPNYVVPVAFVTLAIGCMLVLSTHRRLGIALLVLSVAAFVVPSASASPSASQDAAYLLAGTTGRIAGGTYSAVPMRDKSGILAEAPAFVMTDQADWNVGVQYSSPAAPTVVVGTIAFWTRHFRWCSIRLPGTTGHRTRIDISWKRLARSGSLRIPITFTARAPLQVGSAVISRGLGPKDAQRCR